MRCDDPVIRGHWHVLGWAEEFAGPTATTLLGEALVVAPGRDGWRVTLGSAPERDLPVRIRFGYVWTSLDPAARPLFELPEVGEADRRNIHTCTVGVATSAPRTVENFLDMGHFPFVHGGILGEEPFTEVKDYAVSVDADGVVATNCRFWQPRAATNSVGGAEIDYVYRVPHPYCAILYKDSGRDPNRKDLIALFCQPVDAEHVRASILMSVIDEVSDPTSIRDFQLTIFGQDKPILENQRPRCLPLDTRAETPIRADKTSVAYRRWLSGLGVRYGVIPAAA